ncbi:MAG: 4-(cytidine 5'-diphospho)-2-C-methyl-D-erythritol kinase [Firmicutes bacterium]|nr:4-(cytidine 5'-diphospho)-2-C-methyl-D-erythritol kinase [Bacillota bacterium]
MKLYEDIIITGNRAIAKSYAKINLTLDVLGKTANDYHTVEMIMQTLNLFDLVIVDKAASDISISTNFHFLNSTKNIACRAATLFFERTKISGGAKILIHKNIPVAAGLAGGSGNAAAVLCALNILYDTGLDDNALCSLGAELGADVPYCILGGTRLAEGIGEKLTPLAPLDKTCILIVKPPNSVSTAEIYRKIDSADALVHPDTRGMISAIEKHDIGAVCAKLSNIMESVTSVDCPEILHIKQSMLDFGADGAIMSGSGPTVFAIFRNPLDAKKACDAFSQEYKEVFLTHTLN